MKTLRIDGVFREVLEKRYQTKLEDLPRSQANKVNIAREDRRQLYRVAWSR